MSLADTLLWLCSVPSPIGEERALCDAILARCQQYPLAAPPRRYGNSLVVPLTRRPGAPHVILAGHLDVVRSEHDSPARIEGDRLYGAGAADMKSGLALMLELLAHGSALRVSLSLIFYAREEGPYAENELGDVLALDPELKHADLAVALEPSDNKLQLGCCGSLHASVTFRGRTAHSARPWQGDNAIYKAAALLERLAALKPEARELDGLIYTNVISATLAHGGRGRNIVPDAFELNLNQRFAPDTTIEAARQRISELVNGEAEVRFVDESPAAPPRRTHPLVVALASSGVLAVEAKQAWTDVARFNLHGIAAVNFGPGVQAQAHQRNEWTLISQLDVGDRILKLWLDRVGPP
ncbi:MAG TPA: succinyl-diaminopimelate desuccinylase [Polyangiaceae bacterium]